MLLLRKSPSVLSHLEIRFSNVFIVFAGVLFSLLASLLENGRVRAGHGRSVPISRANSVSQQYFVVFGEMSEPRRLWGGLESSYELMM